jgi:hypothetical protein
LQTSALALEVKNDSYDEEFPIELKSSEGMSNQIGSEILNFKQQFSISSLTFSSANKGD